MNPTITASLISALAALVVCMVNNHFQAKRTEKAHQDNIVLISYRLEELEKKVDKDVIKILATYDAIYRVLVEKLGYDTSDALKIRNQWMASRTGKEG